MGRPKTKMRLDIEEFLADTSKYRDDWMSIQCKSIYEMRLVRSMVYSMRKHGYAIGAVDFDNFTKVVWIARKKDE